jgi:hypothetical protein
MPQTLSCFTLNYASAGLILSKEDGRDQVDGHVRESQRPKPAAADIARSFNISQATISRLQSPFEASAAAAA